MLLGFRKTVWYGLDNLKCRTHSFLDLARLFADARLKKAERASGQLRHAAHYIGAAIGADELYLEGGGTLKRGMEWFDLEWGNIPRYIICIPVQSGL